MLNEERRRLQQCWICFSIYNPGAAIIAKLGSTCSDKLWPAAAPVDKTKGKVVPRPGEKAGILDEWGFMKSVKVPCSAITQPEKEAEKNTMDMRTALQGSPLVLKDCQNLKKQLHTTINRKREILASMIGATQVTKCDPTATRKEPEKAKACQDAADEFADMHNMVFDSNAMVKELYRHDIGEMQHYGTPAQTP